VHISGLVVEHAYMLVVYIKTMRISCALICCFPPAVASASTRSLLVCTSAKQMILIFCLDIVVLVAVLNDQVTLFCAFGSGIRPIGMAPLAPRCLFSRKSCAQVRVLPGYYLNCVHAIRRAASSSLMGSDSFFRPA
jgi:hypothetical protein